MARGPNFECDEQVRCIAKQWEVMGPWMAGLNNFMLPRNLTYDRLDLGYG